MKYDDYLGKVVVPLKAMSFSPLLEGWFALDPSGKVTDGELEIRIELRDQVEAVQKKVRKTTKKLHLLGEQKHKEYLTGLIEKVPVSL